MRATVPLAPPAPLPEAVKPSRLRSIDEIMADIDAISCDPEHRDQFKALKMLAAAKSSAVVLPKPLTDAEFIARIGRLNLAAGPEITRLAWRWAFPAAKRSVEDTPDHDFSTLPEEVMEEAKKIISLRMLYKAFPEVKRTGQPPGFPKGGSLAAKQDWCRDAAGRLILEREQKKSDGEPEAPQPEAT